MKILLLADRMENGGAETHLYELSRLLSQKGHFVTVLSFGGAIAEALAAQGIPQEHYGNHPLLKLWDILKTQKPDVVHAHTRKSAFLCRLLLTFMRFPLVFTAHAHFSTDPIKGTLSFFPRRTIAVSEDIAQHLSSHFGVEKNKISIIQNGIDTERFCPKRNKDTEFNILTTSRLDADCSLTASLLCSIAPSLSKQIPNLHITILGGGSELAKIQTLAAKANALCGKCVVTAVGQKQNVLPYLQNASLFVGVSRAALEAMSCGIPVILSGNEGYLGIAAGNTLAIAELGNFCARGHQKPSKECLFRDILSLYSDKSLALRASRDAFRQIQIYHTAEQMAEKTLRVYRAARFDVIKKRKSDILLCGYYGYGNLGDELSLHAICSRLYAQSRVLTNNEACNPVTSVGLRLSVLAAKGAGYSSLECVDRFRPIAVLKAIRDTGLFMLGGGSLLQNKTSNRSLFYYLTLLEIAHLLGVPTMLYAAGIGPIHGKMQMAFCKRTLQNVDQITVRDASSLDLLYRMGVRNNVRLSADPVLFCQTPSTKNQGYVLLFVRKEELKRFLSVAKRFHTPLCLAVMDKKSDLAATKKLARALKNCGKKVEIFENASAEQIFKLIGGADLVVSARLHALILAFCMGVPFVGLSGDPKITAFTQAAYDACPHPVTRDLLSKQFREKRECMKALAKRDAASALKLAKL